MQRTTCIFASGQLLMWTVTAFLIGVATISAGGCEHIAQLAYLGMPIRVIAAVGQSSSCGMSSNPEERAKPRPDVGGPDNFSLVATGSSSTQASSQFAKNKSKRKWDLIHR